MYVKDHTQPPGKGVRVPGMSEKYLEAGIDFPDSGGAVQVDAQTGEALIEHCSGVREHTPDGDDEATAEKEDRAIDSEEDNE